MRRDPQSQRTSGGKATSTDISAAVQCNHCLLYTSFDGAGGDVQHRAQRHTGEFRADPLAYGAQHSEGCFMRECGGNAMKSAAPQPQDCHNKTVFYVYAHVPASTQEI